LFFGEEFRIVSRMIPKRTRVERRRAKTVDLRILFVVVR